ncbi:MAG: RNA polymerase sigma factor [Actinomycetota bacterium]
MLGASFHDVLNAARAGGEWAWTSIYDDLAPAVAGFVRARGATEPDDLLGEVFLQVVRDLPSFDGDEDDFRSWVFTIAHHRLLDDVRQRARRPVQLMAPEDMGEALGLGDTEQEALGSLGSRRIRELIARLPPDQQDVLLLRLVADLAIDEVARIVGKRPGAVKALQFRGLVNLRREILRQGVSR